MSPPEHNGTRSQPNTTFTMALGKAISPKEGIFPLDSCSTSPRPQRGYTGPKSCPGTASQVDGEAPADAEESESELLTTRRLARFLRETSPPPGNLMSRPDHFVLQK